LARTPWRWERERDGAAVGWCACMGSLSVSVVRRLRASVYVCLRGGSSVLRVCSLRCRRACVPSVAGNVTVSVVFRLGADAVALVNVSVTAQPLIGACGLAVCVRCACGRCV
jgi:hypothetical protein